MSDKPISVGDLVMVVRGQWCCGASVHIRLGKTFVVREVLESTNTKCKHCGAKIGREKLAAHTTGYVAIYKLKHIDPPADARSEDARKPMKEPA